MQKFQGKASFHYRSSIIVGQREISIVFVALRGFQCHPQTRPKRLFSTKGKTQGELKPIHIALVAKNLSLLRFLQYHSERIQNNSFYCVCTRLVLHVRGFILYYCCLCAIIYHHISSLDAYLQTSVLSSGLFIDMLRFSKSSSLSLQQSSGIDPISHLSMLPTTTSQENDKMTSLQWQSHTAIAFARYIAVIRCRFCLNKIFVWKLK